MPVLRGPIPENGLQGTEPSESLYYRARENCPEEDLRELCETPKTIDHGDQAGAKYCPAALYRAQTLIRSVEPNYGNYIT
jgi:hypothetical protein